ncbi:MAG: acetyltransferase [Candidatus Delongbacteria bacterium]|jgi:sugar O-acyltransferase (sialic acid O-acetyltransferase NeuD family)|nr:acetyltransferase [Candidatus Delongbacteria bacterium]
MKKIIILGGLGNGSIIANAILDANKLDCKEWKFAGYLNDRAKIGEEIQGFKVLGSLADTKKYLDEGYYFINTILRIDGQQERIELFETLSIPKDRLATFIHPKTYIAPNVVLGSGTVIMPNVSVNSGVIFGNGCLILNGATIAHDTIFGNYCHVASQACLGGYLTIGSGVHIGLNATIRENLTIGRNSTIGMGAVLTKDVKENEIWVGNPAKFLRMAK